MAEWGFTFKGIHSSTKGLSVIEVGGRSILPGIMSKNFTVPSMHGQHYFGFRFDKRELDVTVLLTATSLDDFRTQNRDLANWLSPVSGISELIFDDEPDRKYKAVVTNTQNWTQTKNWGTSQIRFICPEPFAYALNPKVNPYTTGSFTVQNNANVDTPPKFTFTFKASATELKVQIGTTSFIRVVRNFITGDVLVIDCGKGTIVLNGSDIRSTMDIMSDFPLLGPGTNNITLTPASAANTSIEFTERWI